MNGAYSLWPGIDPYCALHAVTSVLAASFKGAPQLITFHDLTIWDDANDEIISKGDNSYYDSLIILDGI